MYGDKPGLIEMFRPEIAKSAASAAVTWLKPQRFEPAFKPKRIFPAAPLLGRIGPLEVRLAQSKGDVKRAQRLRYKVFYKDGNAIADAATMLAQRDKDSFDKLCDHLLVIDHAAKPSLSGKQPVVGTYRLLRQDIADHHGGFYTGHEFDIAGLMQRQRGLRFLELGRSCVLPPYRTKRTVELLWHGIWTYVRRYQFDVMIGCASFEGTDPKRLALPLSFLHHFARAPEDWRTSALSSRGVDMNMMTKDTIDTKAALKALPPLIKGYLRVGAFIGDGAVVDHQFGTTDVLVVMPVSAINERYLGHFGADASRHAA
ncbi:MAG: GNAT family N-acetyltransferase [Afipia sp.]|nr:GNAT family N-acetyltransferase [Afipia sp.]